MVMNHTQAKIPGQRLVGLTARMEKDGQTDTTDCSILPTNVIGNYVTTSDL